MSSDIDDSAITTKASGSMSRAMGFYVPRQQQPMIFRERNQSLLRRLQRESVRFYRQLSFIALMPNYRYQKWKHDRNSHQRVKFREGTRPLTSRPFVLVLFQPDGLKETTIETCRILSDRGLAVVPISNCDLSKDDADKLAQVCWRFGTRPNYGYDTGAYRDALKLLSEHVGTFDEIFMMNDSIMFPLGGDASVLDELGDLEDGFGGLILKTKSPAKQAKPLWDDFVEAYFYYCKGPLIERGGLFWKVWGTLWLTPGRKHLKEGLSSYILSFFGHRPVTIASRRTFLKKMQNQPCAFIHKTLQYGAYAGEHYYLQGISILEDWTGDEDPEWKSVALSHIEAVVHREQFHHSFLYASIHLFRLTFLKRPKRGRTTASIKAYLAAVQAGDLPKPTKLQYKELVAAAE